MKHDTYSFTYWVRQPQELRIDLSRLANLIVEDCQEVNPDIDALLDYFSNNMDSYLLSFGLPHETVEEDGDYLCNKIYNEISGDLATILDKLLNS